MEDKMMSDRCGTISQVDLLKISIPVPRDLLNSIISYRVPERKFGAGEVLRFKDLTTWMYIKSNSILPYGQSYHLKRSELRNALGFKKTDFERSLNRLCGTIYLNENRSKKGGFRYVYNFFSPEELDSNQDKQTTPIPGKLLVAHNQGKIGYNAVFVYVFLKTLKTKWSKYEITEPDITALSIAKESGMPRKAIGIAIKELVCNYILIKSGSQYKFIKSGSVGSVYFLLGKTTNLVKIGYSVDVERRIKSMQLSEETELIHVITEVTQSKEKELHRQFEHLREIGEWFRLEKDLIDFFKRQVIMK